MFDLLTIGDTTLDVFMHVQDAEVNCELKHKTCQLCIGFGEKIPINAIKNIYGVGNSPNVAVGTSRLGLKSAIYTILGNDHSADETCKVFRAEKVGMDYVVFDKNKPTDYSVVLMYTTDRTILVYHEERNYKLPKFPKVPWLFLGSIGQDPTKIHNQILRYLAKDGTRLVFNPGPVQLRQSKGALLKVVEDSYVFIVNKHEAQQILGMKKQPKALLRELSKVGADIVVITDDGHGSYCTDGRRYLHLPSCAKHVLETTGAGDSYTTGFVAALHYGLDIADAMRWGSFNAASVLEHVGARDGLLTKAKLEKIAKKEKKFIAKSL